jgi:hypothetical protein
MNRQIASYAHCAHCVRENCYPNIAVGITTTGTHLEVWCETHDVCLGVFELKEPMPPMPCEKCGKTKRRSKFRIVK